MVRFGPLPTVLALPETSCCTASRRMAVWCLDCESGRLSGLSNAGAPAAGVGWSRSGVADADPDTAVAASPRVATTVATLATPAMWRVNVPPRGDEGWAGPRTPRHVSPTK